MAAPLDLSRARINIAEGQFSNFSPQLGEVSPWRTHFVLSWTSGNISARVRWIVPHRGTYFSLIWTHHIYQPYTIDIKPCLKDPARRAWTTLWCGKYLAWSDELCPHAAGEIFLPQPLLYMAWTSTAKTWRKALLVPFMKRLRFF